MDKQLRLEWLKKYEYKRRKKAYAMQNSVRSKLFASLINKADAGDAIAIQLLQKSALPGSNECAFNVLDSRFDL